MCIKVSELGNGDSGNFALFVILIVDNTSHSYYKLFDNLDMAYILISYYIKA